MLLYTERDEYEAALVAMREDGHVVHTQQQSNGGLIAVSKAP